MSRAVVTGGLGGAASWIVSSLAEQGWDVRSIDFQRPSDPAAGPANVDFRAADLTEQGQTWELISEFDPDYVIHYAAYPNPLGHGGARVYENNTISTYNVLSGAGSAGADVIWASSETVYGTVFAEPSFLPDYFPIDTDHPTRPEDPYGTSKVTGEEIAKMVTRRHDVSVASIRPSWINYPGNYDAATIREHFDMETASLDDDFGVSFHNAAGNFFSYVDIRDVVSLTERAMEVDFDGHEPFMAVAKENLLGVDTADAVEATYGDLPSEVDLEGDQSAIDYKNARDVLDWEPEHSWREAEGESVDGPSFV
ncbi:NAD-dependent epimerase/dehydratase family protein [Halorubrum salsamenti]|uniref:NAD-dependent epimerase/dehydratase family protein n=1 Tax=Halorubrum salsamenti TaxID=2583990 RepID=UPI00119ED52F|nr:NAD(P)-dependent oxidoreductase [Halorubrum salsamenti]